MATRFGALEGKPNWFAAADPINRKLGSGGGTAHLLVSAWRATGNGRSFDDWLAASPKLIVHGGGQSRRLPAYAAVGKPLLPIPVLRWSRGQRLNQTLLDLQAPAYERILQAGSHPVLVTSGDVLLRFHRQLPAFPKADVVAAGMWVTAECASNFGVFCLPRNHPGRLAFFLQKPSVSQIRQLSADYLCPVDTGMWLLSARAVALLLAKSGWDAGRQTFAEGDASAFDLYGEFGYALGSNPTRPDPEIAGLTCAVVPLPDPEFHHFGTNTQLIESISRLQNRVLDESRLGSSGGRRHPDQYVQNSRVGFALRQEENHTLWVENSVIPASWELAHSHILTGVPDNQWRLRLPAGTCLDFVPVGKEKLCVRPYGIGDDFTGAIGDPGTRWLGRSAADWLKARNLQFQAAGVDPKTDIQQAPLFPVLATPELTSDFLEWLVSPMPSTDPARAKSWLEAERLSAQSIASRVNLERLYAQRSANRNACLKPLLTNRRWNIFYRLDLVSTARWMAASGIEPQDDDQADPSDLEPMESVRQRMVRAALLRERGQPWEACEDQAFDQLRELIEREAVISPVSPHCAVQADQIVWGRSPARLDLAGGWTDTPPYCLEHGGRAVNLAVDLNGQPPQQVFVRLSDQPELVIRSIDLGLEQRIASYAELESYAQPGSGFSLAKAALALAGFLPRFNADGHWPSLHDQLRAFGGGIEISMVAAVPKGSGLGTSSIMAATLLAGLGDFCGLNWDKTTLFLRTLALEQMVTSGGGWQDQAGGIFHGIKSIETSAGLSQRPTLRWLPEGLFGGDYANRSILLYYSGLTRLAKGILQQVVRGVLLNSPEHLSTLEEIGANAELAFDAVQKADYDGLGEAIRRSWRSNQTLDAGTNPPAIQHLLAPIEDYTLACKLLGAGGGGYLLLLAKDEEAGRRIRKHLADHPPNAGARFVDFKVSATGLQLSRS
ncbi:MAG: bifunctional fucokinase/L-fucose-1-P-guanylyltransferase [Verrucomicrobia bacterium]|nr:bifunctional fucokinase/L-fucose-1-P-guanylyltransferase [Verrucomicrobiota bacterium]